MIARAGKAPKSVAFRGFPVGLRTCRSPLDLVANTDLIDYDLMLIVKDVSRQLVVHAHTITQLFRFESGVPDLDTKFGFERTNGVFDFRLRDLFHGDQNVEPVFELSQEHAGDADEVQRARLAQMLEQGLAVYRRGLEEKGLQGLEFGKIFVHGIRLNARPLRAAFELDVDLLAPDDVGAFERVDLGPSGAPDQLGAATDVVERELLGRVKKKKAKQFHSSRTTEQNGKRISHTRVGL